MRARRAPSSARGGAIPVREAGAARSPAAGIARGAAVIAVITIAARILGLVRTLVFSQTVGATCLGTAYVTANQVPNLVYELVLGGALASVMVPLLARSAERSSADPAERAQVSQVTSALLTWCVVLLAPLTLLIVGVAGPIAALLNPANPSAACVHAEVVSTTASMLRVFAPQALLYGLSVVLLGLLQAYRRFAAYALAPLINSLVVIASFVAFVPLGRGLPLGRLPVLAELVLAAGATLGVAAMVLVGIVPAWRLRLRFRLTLRLPIGIGRRARGLALVGVAEMIANEIESVVVIDLANGHGSTGALVLFNYGFQVFNTLNAVLALSIVLSAFPVLSARDGPVFERTCAGSTRAVMLASWLGVALVAAVALPAARVLAGSHGQVSELALGFAFFAPGLVGMGVIANLARAMLAVGRLRIAATAVASCALLGVVAQLVLVALVPPRLVVAALALGYTIGQTAAAIPLVLLTRRVLGKATVAGVGRATVAGLAAAAVASVVGVGVSLAIPESHRLVAALAAVVAACCAAAAFGAIAFWLDDGDLRAVVATVRRAVRLRSALRGGGYLDRLVRLRRLPARRPSTTQTTKGMMRMNWADPRDDGLTRREEPPAVLTRRQRQAAIGIGVLAGGAGAYAVFASSNQAGTFVLLLTALVFLLTGVEGTPLLRRTGTRLSARRRYDAAAEAQRGNGLETDTSIPEPRLARHSAVPPPGPDDGSGLFTS
jgi:putative peptidoglycan lipid II flippase